MAEEYYVRSPDSDAARGPYDLDKLQTLAEAGQITRETLYYDDNLESWAAIGANEELQEQVFPKKKKLSLSSGKSNKEKASLADEDNSRESISVDEMLAAAEGDTEETRYLKEKERWQNRAAAISIPTLAFVCAITAATYIYPSMDIVRMILNNEPDAISAVLQKPLLILGTLDLIFTICLALSATEIFPLLRFRVMLAMGFFGLIYWGHHIAGDPTGIPLAGCVAAYGIGVYICTLTLNFKLMVSSAALALVGSFGFLYFTTIAPLLAG